MRSLRILHRSWVLLLGFCGLLVACWSTAYGTDLDPVLKGKWPERPVAEILAVAVAEHHAYLACGWAGLQVIDISNPTKPRRVGGYEVDGNGQVINARAVAVSGNYAYLASWDSGLQVIDITNPVNPRGLGIEMSGGSSGTGVAVGRNHAYLASWDSGLQVFDVSDATKPHWVGAYNGISVLGVVVSDNYAYLAAGSAGLEILDITTPARPRRMGGHNIGGGAQAVAVSGNYAYVASEGVWNDTTFVGAGLEIIDTTDPTAPLRVGAYETGGRATAVTVLGHHAFVAVDGAWDGNEFVGASLQVIDVSDPVHPRRVGGYNSGRTTAPAVAVAGNSCYLANNILGFGPIAGFLDVIDVSEPANLRRQGGLGGNGPAQDVAIAGNYAYVADSEVGLQILDISNPGHPEHMGEFFAGRDARGVAVSGNLACVALGDLSNGATVGGGRLQLVDITDPANPVRLGMYRTESSAEDVAILGHYAYVADLDGGLLLFDISNPASPRRVGDFRGYGARALAVSGNLACVVDRFGLQLVDIGTPSQPEPKGALAFRGDASDVVISGHYAYLTIPATATVVIDVSDPANPRQVSERRVTGRGAMAVSGNLLACAADGFLELIDITNPLRLRRVGGLGVWDARAVALSGDYAYVADGSDAEGRLKVIDITSSANPQRVGGVDTIGSSSGVAVAGGYAYTASYADGLQVIDINEPANPRRVGGVKTSGYAHDVAVSGNYAYVADGDSGLQVIDITNPARPQRSGSFDTSGRAAGVAVSGKYAYVADYEAGLQVIDISDDANPRRAGGYNSGGIAYDVELFGNHAYVADGHGGLLVIEISNPASPRLIARHAASYPVGVAVSGNYAYLVDSGETGGLQVIDISKPANPRRVGGYITGRWARSVAVFGNYACVAGEGLHVLDISNPADPRLVGRNSVFLSANGVALGDGKVYVAAENYSGTGNEGLVVLEMLPFFKSISRRDGEFHLNWEGWGKARLQGSANLFNPDWEDLHVPEAANSISLPIISGQEFFRLRSH